MGSKKTITNMRIFYFLIFFSMGGLAPLLSVYLQNDVGLTGSQIGIITSMGPIIMLLSQPLWGMLSDYTKRPPLLLTVAALGTGIIGLTYVFAEQYIYLVIIASSLAVFQSALIPLTDSLAMNYVYENGGDYGSIRAWGAGGFAIAVWLMGIFSDYYGLSIIFYVFAAVLFLSAIFSLRMPKERVVKKVDLKKGIKSLIKVPQFLLFLLVTFLVFGPIMANNFYFGLFIQSAGGTLAGVGFAFLLAAGSEIPFMRAAGIWIEKKGILKILIFASLISAIRWFFYWFEPNPIWIYITTIFQGFSIGLFVPAALQYVINQAPKEVSATAVSLYAAVGNGLGAWFFSITAGVIMEYFSVTSIYLFFGIMTVLGVLILFIIQRFFTKDLENHIST